MGGMGHFLRRVEQQSVTVLDLPTSFWHALVQELEAGQLTLPSCVRLVIIGGQAADPGLTRRWFELVDPRVRLVNAYGPTEATVAGLTADLTPDALREGSPVPIGRPLPGVAVRIEPLPEDPETDVPVGSVGELLLGGAQVALGYLGRPEQTAERFVELDGVRWYRTGDRVRLRTDGQFEFLGRIDDQVKIRGYRIEPGEIEAALLELPEVREAAVLVRNGAGGDAELVAHVVAAPGASVTARDLLRGLARSLPSYMFPAQIRFHDDLPRTPGGKPDRRVLLEGSEAPPATAPSPSAPPPAAPVAERLPLTPAQQGLLYTHLLEPTSPALNVAFALRFEGPLDVSRLDAALRAVLTRHEGLRARIDLDDDGRPWQWVDPAEPMPLTIVDVAGATPEERAARLAELTGAPFRIRGEALVRAALLRDAPQDHTLVVVAHHLVIDATSVGVLIEELVGAYRDPNRGVGPDSPADRYADAVRSRAAAEEGPDLDWWLAHLADAPRAVGLPAAPSPGPDERRVCELGETMRRELDRTAAALRVTPFALACTAFALVVSELTGQDDLVLGIPMNDRDPTQARAVGMFVNTLPVRIRLDRDVPVRSVVQEVASSVFAALTHRSAAIGSVVARLGRGRGADARTLYTTAFQLLGDPDQPVDLRIPGLVVSTVRTGRPAASQYDLSVDVTTHGSGLAVRIDRRGSVLGADGGVLVERRFRDLLGSLLGDPDRTIASLLRPPAPAPAPTPAPAPAPAPAPVQVQVPPVVAGDPVLDVWREAFGDPSIGPDDDFFLSGGHSLLAVRLFSLLERRLGVELPMSLLFDHPTPRALGAAVLPTVEDGRVPAAVEVQAPAAQPASEPSPAPTRLGLTRAPLSFAQERFWLLRRMDDTDPYQIRLAWRLVGRLDVAAFGAAVDAVVARHEALRTRFRQYDDGVPYQLVDPPAPVPIAHHDLRTASDPMAALAAVEQELHRPFALDEEWPLRVALAREDDNVHVVVLVLHHIAADGEAVGRIARDLSVAYAAAVSGEDPSLPPPALQYVDHAVRQRADAQHPDSRIERDLAYWRERLDPPPEPLLLPRTGSASADGAAGLVRLTGEAELIAGIRRCAAELRTTATTLLLAATGIALARITGRSDLVIGLPVSERDTPGGGSPDGGASMGDTPVGVMVNTLPFRFRLDPSATVREVVQTVRADLLAALEHRSAPFDHVVRAVGAIRNGVESPLVDVALNVHEERRSATGGLELTGLVATPVARLGRRTAGAKFDLTLTAELSDRLDLLLEHRSDGLETDVVASWGSMVLAVLAGILEDPDRPVDRIPSVDASTTRWLLEVCNGPARAYPRDERIDRLVARTAAAHPDRPAVVDASGGTTLDYRGLVEQAEALAERLRSAGVEPGDRVVLVLDRSPLLVVAMLACLRAGAAYVPVEPSQPEARTALVLEHVDAAAVVRTDALGQAVVEPTNPVRSDRATTEETGAAPAYVMSTSGSTGAPKGVVVPHRAVLRLVCGTDYLQLGPDDVVAFASNPAFDAATWEVWGALVHGARLVVLDRDTVTSADRLHAALREHGVTAMFVTTALFNLLTRHRPDLFSGLRAVLFGGEACDPAAVARVLAAGPPERVLHVYGPTESTTFACWSPIDRVPAGARTLPIGLPIANTTAHVLDDRGGLVPPGVVGELYLGGDGLALGYLGDPKLTERRFVPDPFRGSPDARLYRTGDLVRRRPDGELEFVGRVDRQVKVRGFRIEPEEIEAAMLTHPGVAAAVVETRRDPEGVTLVGYASGSIDERSLRRHLEQRLPAAMVPTRLVVRPDLPVNANGKLDRAALRAAADEVGPPPIPARPSVQRQDSSPAEPSGPVPALWAEVLGLVDPDPDATFFELGGHSLLAVQLLTAIQQTTGVELPLSTLFEHQTLRALAAVVDERRGGEQVGRDPLLVPLRPNGHGAPLFCIHPAGGHLFHYERLVAHLPEGRPVFGITAEGLDGRTPWAPSVEAMAERYIRAMRSLVPQGPFAVAGFSSGASVAYEAVRQLAATGDALDGLVLLDPPFHRQPPRSSTVEAALRRIREEGLHGLTNGLAHRFGAGAVRDRKARLRYAVARRRDVPVDAVTAGRVNQLHHQAILPAYRPEPAPTPIRTLLVRAVSDPTCVTVADEERTVWESLVGAPVTVCTVAGTHRGPESFLAEPRVVEVASAVHRFLDEQSLGQQGLDGRSGR
jgi:amino acid adenylation domain-containing protein